MHLRHEKHFEITKKKENRCGEKNQQKRFIFFKINFIFDFFFSLLREKYLQNDLKQNIEDLLGFFSRICHHTT